MLDHHALLKTKRVRGYQAKFMTKELSKSIVNTSRFKNRYLKCPSREKFLAYKKAKNLCNSLNKKAKKTYSTIKRFNHNNDISIDIENKIIEDETELAKTCRSHYIDILKKYSW